jgi:hypothetical protein
MTAFWIFSGVAFFSTSAAGTTSSKRENENSDFSGEVAVASVFTPG